MSWFYVDRDRRQAEIAEEELAGLIDTGTVTAETLVWKEGLADWVPAAQAFPERFPSSPARLPAAAPTQPASQTPALVTPGFPPPASGMAVASLICGILTLVGCWIVAAIPGAICGHIALGQIRSAPNLYGGRGIALAGLILSYIGIVVTVVILLVYAVFFLGVFGLAAAGAASGGTP